MRKSDRNAKHNDQCDEATPGSMLRHAREAAGLSIDQVAAKLYLLRSVIKNLEADKYERVRGDTFVRGYLRNYARLLGMPSEQLLQSYEEYNKGQVPPDLLADGRGRRIRRDASRIGSFALMLGIGALPLVSKRDAPPESPYSKTSATQVESTQFGSSKSRS